MTVYRLYLESGPRMKKTMVHVPDLMGCVAVGPTTQDAINATPDAVRLYLRFLTGIGERVDQLGPFDLQVVEHITEGEWMGNGSPYVLFACDTEPVTEAELKLWLARFAAMQELLATWADGLTDAELDGDPTGGGRTIRSILLHVIGPVGGYLSAFLGGAPGFSATQGAAERGELPMGEALRRTTHLASERVRATTPEERSSIRPKEKSTRTLRKAMRRMLEHDWEHLAELSRRPGGPVIG